MSSRELRDESEVSPLGEHLDELRNRIVRIAILFIILSVVAFFFKDILFDKILLYPKSKDFITNRFLCAFGKFFNTTDLCINDDDYQLINLDMAGQFNIHMMLSVIAGFIIGLPYYLWEIWQFIKPALAEKEVKKSRGIIFYISFLFIVGILFGYFLITPMAINFFTTYSVSDTLVNQFRIQSFISILTTTTLSTGVAFELPVVIYFLSKIGLATPAGLKRLRKHAIIVLLIIAAILTPADPFSMFLVAVPLYFLYEISIIIASSIYKQEKKKGYIVE